MRRGLPGRQTTAVATNPSNLGHEALHGARVDELADGLRLEVRPDGFMFSRSPGGGRASLEIAVTE